VNSEDCRTTKEEAAIKQRNARVEDEIRRYRLTLASKLQDIVDSKEFTMSNTVSEVIKGLKENPLY
jgi:hypothetical protein